jgi:archaemetzincin
MEDKGIRVIVTIAVIASVAVIVFLAVVYGKDLVYGTKPEQPDCVAAVGRYYLIPVGEVPKSDLEFAEKALEAGTGMEFTVTSPIPLWDEAYLPERSQYLITKMTYHVGMNMPEDTIKAVGLTAADLTTEDRNFLYGLGYCPGPCCILSTAHLKSETTPEWKYRARLFRLLLHEHGHNYGLLHCRSSKCIMAYSSGASAIDRQRLNFCIRCSKALSMQTGADTDERVPAIKTLAEEYAIAEHLDDDYWMSPPAPFDLSRDPVTH